MKTFVTVLLVLVSTAAFAATGTRISYRVHGEEFEGYYISPAASAPLVFLIHDRDGLTDHEIKRASMLAERGYAVFCADMYGKGVRPTGNKEEKQLTGRLYKDRSRMAALLNGGLAAAKAQGADLKNAVAMGFSFGGTVVRELLRTGSEMNRFVIFHDGLALPEEMDYPEARMQIFVRCELAERMTISDAEELAALFTCGGIKQEETICDGVSRGVTVWDSSGCRAGAEKESWQRFLAVLVVSFKP